MCKLTLTIFVLLVLVFSASAVSLPDVVAISCIRDGDPCLFSSACCSDSCQPLGLPPRNAQVSANGEKHEFCHDSEPTGEALQKFREEMSHFERFGWAGALNPPGEK
ncbi:hypothetical protein FPV67DRAFT_1444579 [Lyophyllum atratum]|nr:hypothetical protein FPV67DRAFT_1444579 [Lyophyllum atratum]